MSITRADNFDFVAYWHVELKQHGIVLAEGAPAESFLQWGDNRPSFTWTLGEPRNGTSPLAAPFALQGHVVEAVHRRLQLRAEASVFCKAQKPMPPTMPGAAGIPRWIAQHELVQMGGEGLPNESVKPQH
jgi:hypothetical protein